MINVCVAFDFFNKEISNISKDFPQCNFMLGAEHAENADIIWGNLSPSKLKDCKNLKFMQLTSSGANAYNNENVPNTMVIASATGAYTLSISEYLLSVHLSLYRKLHLYRDNQNESIWQSTGKIKSVKNSVVLVYGMGSIGGAYAKLVKNMGAYVIGVRRTDLTKPDFADEIYLSSDLEKVIGKADMVAICAPGTEKTQKVFNKDMISKMKDGAMLMNIGRGSIVDTEALCDALESGKLAGVGLDVVDPEPLPKEHRLWQIPNAILTPHTSGGNGVEDVPKIMIEIFKQNLNNFIENKPLINLVDLNEGYITAK